MGEVGAGEYDYLELQNLQTAVSGGLGMGASLRSKVDDKDKISAWLTLTTKSLTQKFDAIHLLKLAFEQLRFDEKIESLSYCSNVRHAGSLVYLVLVIVMQCRLLLVI